MSQNKRVRGVSVFRPIIYGNTAILLPPEERGESDHTHRWTVGIRSAASPAQPKRTASDQIGGADDLSYFIKKVSFKLHETYPQSLRSIEKPPFEVTETGWGEFDIVIKIFFVAEASEKPITFTHHLKLHPWPTMGLDGTPLNPSNNAVAAVQNGAAQGVVGTLPPVGGEPTPVPNSTEGTPEQQMQVDSNAENSANPTPVNAGPTMVLSPIHSWQYEEIVFSEPTETFYTLLLSRPPTMIPKSNRHPKNLVFTLGQGGNFGEFSQDMEREEAERLDKAKLNTLEEVEKLRQKLIKSEKELVALRKEVDEIAVNQAAKAAAEAAALSTAA